MPDIFKPALELSTIDTSQITEAETEMIHAFLDYIQASRDHLAANEAVDDHLRGGGERATARAFRRAEERARGAMDAARDSFDRALAASWVPYEKARAEREALKAEIAKLRELNDACVEQNSRLVDEKTRAWNEAMQLSKMLEERESDSERNGANPVTWGHLAGMAGLSHRCSLREIDDRLESCLDSLVGLVGDPKTDADDPDRGVTFVDIVTSLERKLSSEVETKTDGAVTTRITRARLKRSAESIPIEEMFNEIRRRVAGGLDIDIVDPHMLEVLERIDKTQREIEALQAERGAKTR